MVISQSQVKLSLRVSPNAVDSEIVDFQNGVLRVRISAPPVKDSANKELIAFLSKVFDVSKSRISIVKGHNTRNKVIAVDNIKEQVIMERLSAYLRH